jgi:hypothetical protein
MKKLACLVIFASALLGSAAMVSCSCNKDDSCDRAADRCRECYTGSEQQSCLTSVDACRILLPGPPRDNCCDGVYDSLRNCQ